MNNLLNLDDADLESLANDLCDRWRQYDDEQMSADLQIIIWVSFRLGWSRGFSDCHNEWELERESKEKQPVS